MKLRIERAEAHVLASEFPELASLLDQLRFGAHAEVGLQQLAPAAQARANAIARVLLGPTRQAVSVRCCLCRKPSVANRSNQP